VPGDSTTIQGGINGAVNGDTVMVSPGTYYERINFQGKAITVKSEQGPLSTIIDANRVARAVSFFEYEGNNSIIDGFTLMNGESTSGGGIFCRGSPTIVNNIIRNNEAVYEGGGIECSGGNPIILNNLIIDNLVHGPGGGIHCWLGASPIISGNTIYNNFAGNGGGIYCEFSDPVLIDNNIIRDNSPNEIYLHYSELFAFYSNIKGGYEGEGNIDEDPLFVDPDNHSYYLSQDPCQPGIMNPCVDTGDPNSIMTVGTTRTDGVQDDGIIDMGYHYPHTTGNVAPYARFNWTPAIPEPDEIIEFDATESFDLDGYIILYEWDWDDDGVYDESYSVPTATHSWPAQGFYPVTLRITDDDGEDDMETLLVAVNDTIYIPDDFGTIQDAIDISRDGHTIIIKPGIYLEHDIDFLGKAITVMGTDPEDSTVVASTIVNGGSMGSVFLFQSGENPASVLTGLTITSGNATNGGGIYCYESSPIITFCTFNANRAAHNGGGIYNNHSNPAITDCVLIRNSAGGGGGGIASERSSPTVNNCIFSGNSASEGGGMYFDNDNDGNPTVTNCTFNENHARWGGGIHNQDYVDLVLTNCTFIGNSAGWNGGGMQNEDAGPTVINCTFIENSASSTGGGINNWYFIDPTVINCIFIGNSAEYGGGMFSSDNNPTVTNCTLVGNSASINGGGMANYKSNPTVTNCILWGDSGGEIKNDSSNPVVTYCNVDGGYPGDGNFDADPQFVNPGNGNYHLSSESPCVDAGTEAGVYDDFEGDPRPQGNDYDIGADESFYSINYNLTLTPSGPTTVHGGDLFCFRTLIQNHMGSPVSGDYWLSILLPSLNEILIPKGFLNYPNPLSGQVPAGGSLQLDNWLSVPGGAPDGSYSLIGRIGAHPNTVIDADTVGVEIVE
jgi:hypothetical protein